MKNKKLAYFRYSPNTNIYIIIFSKSEFYVFLSFSSAYLQVCSHFPDQKKKNHLICGISAILMIPLF